MRLSRCILALALFAADAHAQRAFAEQGVLALTVGLAGLDNVSIHPLGGGVGLRYRAAERTVLGAAVGVAASARESTSGGRTSEIDGTWFSLAARTEQHVGASRRTVSPFVGLGVRAEVTADEAEFDRGDGTVDSQRSETRTAGAGLLVGAEVRLARGVTLGGAYTLGEEYRMAEQHRSGTAQPSEFDEGRIGVGTTQVALSVYF